MIEKALGFVIKRRPFRETSVIADIYTLGLGKITGIFKGFYTLKKEFSSSLDVLTLNEFIFYPKKSHVWLVSYADFVCGYPFLREDLNKSKIAALFVDLIDKTLPHWDKNDDIFYLLKDCLDWLGRGKDCKALYIFLIKFLTLSGFKPEFNRCIVCHREWEGEIYFSVSRGGLVCKHCCAAAPDAKKIRREVSASLQYIQDMAVPKAHRLKLTAFCEKEIFYLLGEFLLYHLEFDISKKLKFNN